MTNYSVAACGLNCTCCKSFKSGKCPGCRDNAKASWCDIRKCCIGRDFATCAECPDHTDPHKCKKFNNLPGKVIGFLFNTDRFKAIDRIREIGAEGYAAEMTAAARMAPKRR